MLCSQKPKEEQAMKGILGPAWKVGSTLIEGAEEVHSWAIEAIGLAAEAIDWLAEEAPIAYEKAKPYLETAKDEAFYVGLNVAGLPVIGILLLAKGITTNAQHLGKKGQTLAKGAQTLGKKAQAFAKRTANKAIGLAGGFKAGLAQAWQFRSELIAEWA